MGSTGRAEAGRGAGYNRRPPEPQELKRNVTALRQPTTRRTPPRADRSLPYINRELSWLDYAARILHLAQDERNPLLERVRYLAIFAYILDEFFQVRVAGVKQQVAAGHSKPTPDGMSSPQVLDAIRGRVLQLQTLHSRAFGEIRDCLSRGGDPDRSV